MPDEGFTELAGDRVALRRFGLADAAEFAAYRSASEVARYQSWDAPYSFEDGVHFIRQMMKSHPDTPGEWFQFAVVLLSTGQLIGDCAARPDADDPRQCDIGFTIAPDHQGRGYATEAARLLVGYLFESRGKHRVAASCDARNAASAAVLERLGMRREGHLREGSWAKGEWTDDLLYAVLDHEWTRGAMNDGTGRPQVRRWLAAYESAWRAPGTEALGSLFTGDASYLHSPYEQPVAGLDAIKLMWEEDRQGPDEVFTLATEILAVDGPVAVVRAEVSYGDPPRQQYRDLWVVRFADDGRCTWFEEWAYWPGRPYTAAGDLT